MWTFSAAQAVVVLSILVIPMMSQLKVYLQAGEITCREKATKRINVEW